MALVTPIIDEDISAFDATEQYVFSFLVMGGDQVNANVIRIKDNTTGADVYTNTTRTYNYYHAIPANILQNGHENGYTVSIKTQVIGNNNEIIEESEWSNEVAFFCFSTPQVSINIIDGSIIEGSNVSVSVTYNQAEKEILNYGIINLYDEEKNLIDTSLELYHESGIIPPTTLSYKFSGLSNGAKYYIRAEILTEYNTSVVTDYIGFTAQYHDPVFHSMFLAEPNNCNGYTLLKSNVVIANGKYISGIDGEQPRYIDKQNIDLVSSVGYIDSTVGDSRSVEFDNGYSVPSNFLLRLWFNPALINKTLMLLYNQDRSYKLQFDYCRGTDFDYVEVTDSDGAYYVTNGVEHSNGNVNDFLWVKIVGDKWDIRLEQLSKEKTNAIWNDNNNNCKYNMTTDEHLIGENFEEYTKRENHTHVIEYALTDLLLADGIFDKVDITTDTSIDYTTEKPPQFTYNTLLDADFNENLNGGSSDIVLNQVSAVVIKRKESASSKNLWTTIYRKKIKSLDDLKIQYKDYMTPAFVEQTYALVPIMADGTEGGYIEINTTPKWNGTFITDGTETFKLVSSVIYDSFTQNVSIGTFSPIGKQYPTVVQNATTNYRSGTISTNIIGTNTKDNTNTFYDNRTLNRGDIVKETNDFVRFLTNGKSKIMVDWNGNIILFKVNSTPSIVYNANFGNGKTTVQFSFVEQGKYDNQQDLIDNNLITI